MKKALVLGILAIFAISINANAQDPTVKDPTAGQTTSTQSHFQQAPASQPATTTSGTLQQQSVNPGQTTTTTTNNTNFGTSNSRRGANQGANRRAVDNLNGKKQVNDLNAIPPQDQKPKAPVGQEAKFETEENGK